ncbi:MAG: potassium channel family protein [Methylococcaceae bacterium]
MTIFNWFIRRIAKAGAVLTESELMRSLILLVLLVVAGTLAFSATEGWTLFNALYATIITLTTVGYGDMTPQSTEGRLFAIVFTFTAITLGGYAFTNLSVYAIQNRERMIAARYRRKLMNRIESLNKHYIVCGADWLGTRIAEDFNSAGVGFIVIDTDRERLKKALLHTYPGYFRQKIKCLMNYEQIDLSEYESLSIEEVSEKVGIAYLLADPTDVLVLLQAGIERAAGLVTTCDDDRDNLSIVIGARNLAKRSGNDGLKIMARVNDPREMKKLYLAGADHVRIPTIVSGREMASHILHPEIGNWWYSRSGSSDKSHSLMEQFNIDAESDWCGLTIAELHARHCIVTLSIKRAGQFISPPPHDCVLQDGDIAIVLAGSGG